MEAPDTNERHYWEIMLRTKGFCLAARSKVKLESNAAQEANTEPSAERSHYDVATLPHHD